MPEPQQPQTANWEDQFPDATPQNTAGALGFIWNIPKSTVGLLAPFAHPVETAEGIGNLALGLTETVAPGAKIGEGHKQYASALGQALKERYGGWENIKKTAYEDPAGFAADVSAVLSGGSLALRGGARAASLARLPDLPGVLRTAANVTKKASRYTDPLRPVTATVGGAAKLAGKTTRELLGMVTGVGSEPLRLVAENPAGARAAMRHKISDVDLVNDFDEALSNLKATRASDYQGRLAQISQSQQALDLAPIQQRLPDELRRFGVEVSPVVGASPELEQIATQLSGKPFKSLNPVEQQVARDLAQRAGLPTDVTIDYRLDLSKTPIAKPSERALFEDIVRSVMMWDDPTPAGVDFLKRRVGDWWSESNEARAFVQRVKGSLRDLLNREVPGYQEMTRTYEEYSRIIDNARTELSLGRNVSPGTAIRKLSYALNTNNEYRKLLIEQLNQFAKGDLETELAGWAMRNLRPRGLMGPLEGASILHSALRGNVPIGRGLVLAASSPRLVGESLMLLSAGKRLKAGLKPVVDPAVYRTLNLGQQAERLAPVPGAETTAEAAEPVKPAITVKAYPRALVAGFAQENGITVPEAERILKEQGWTIQ